MSGCDISASPPAAVDIPAILSRARRHQGYSLRQVESLTGIHNAHVSQVETGRIKRPGLALLFELARFYKLDFALLTETGYEDTPHALEALRLAATTPNTPGGSE